MNQKKRNRFLIKFNKKKFLKYKAKNNQNHPINLKKNILDKTMNLLMK